MVKKGHVKSAENFYEMDELEATGKYAKTLGEVYKKEGILSAIGYEVDSTLYSLRKRLSNLLGSFASEDEAKYESFTYSGGKAMSKEGYELSKKAEQALKDRQEYKKIRTAERKEFLLRGVSEDYAKARKRSSVGAAATASIIALIGSIFFLSTNLTGNVIGNITNSAANWIGGILFIVGLVLALVYFKTK